MAAFTVIDHTELTGSETSWTKTSIPSSYDHLYLIFSTRTDSPSGERDEAEVILNNDTGTNYSLTQMWAGENGSGAGSQQTTGDEEIAKIYINGDGSTADTFGAGTLWIPNYANTTGYKQVLTHAACEGATTTNYRWGLSLCAGLWASTAAINQITLQPVTGTNFVQYSTFTLYGVTGA